MANLSLKMMLAYKDCNIISIIKTSILSNNGAWERFDALFLSNVVECERQCVMAYIMERYANMRGTFFVRHLKCNSGNQIQKLVKIQATRTKVSHLLHKKCERRWCALAGVNSRVQRPRTVFLNWQTKKRRIVFTSNSNY